METFPVRSTRFCQLGFWERLTVHLIQQSWTPLDSFNCVAGLNYSPFIWNWHPNCWCLLHLVVDNVKTTVHPALCDPCSYSLPYLRPEKSKNREIEKFWQVGQDRYAMADPKRRFLIFKVDFWSWIQQKSDFQKPAALFPIERLRCTLFLTWRESSARVICSHVKSTRVTCCSRRNLEFYPKFDVKLRVTSEITCILTSLMNGL